MSDPVPEAPPTPSPEGPAGYVELVRGNVHFRRLWFGNIISLLGDWFNTIALYTLVSELTGSPLALGAVFITKMLPAALASPLAGVIVDRFSRRRVMIGSDLLRAVVVLGFLVVDTPGEVYLVYVLTTLQVVIGAVFQPAQSASLPNITTPRELLTANALMAATWSALLTLGAALGGFAAAWLGLKAVFVLDSLTYLVSAFFIYRTVIPQDTEGGAGLPVRAAFGKIAEGWRYLRVHPPVARIALAKATWALGGGALVYMLTLLGETLTPGATSVGIGVLFAARGFGTGVGPVLARAFFRDRRRWPVLIGACIAFSGLCYGVVGGMPWTFAVAVFVVAAHATSGANWVLSTVLLQERSADRYRGRVFATEWLLIMLTDAVSILAASLLLEAGVLSLRGGFLVFAALQVASGLAWLLVVPPRERAEA
ncbi:MAG: MFS transporter [Rhodothermaceae bacterium]|nr:MAG: MFS transporter [Rhodothermaceae bacterium]